VLHIHHFAFARAAADISGMTVSIFMRNDHYWFW